MSNVSVVLIAVASFLAGKQGVIGRAVLHFREFVDDLRGRRLIELPGDVKDIAADMEEAIRTDPPAGPPVAEAEAPR